MAGYVEKILLRSAKIRARYDELNGLIDAPEITADGRYWRRLSAEREGLEEAALAHAELLKLHGELSRCGEELNRVADSDLRALIAEEAESIASRAEQVTARLSEALLYAEITDVRGAVIEIRAVEGGDAAESFSFCLMQMYAAYAKTNGFEFIAVDAVYSAPGRLRSVDITVPCAGAYARLKAESGIHKAVGFGKDRRTAFAAVSVFPAVDTDGTEISEKDLRIDIFRSSGAGGQNVNKVETAVRVTHIPTGTVSICQDERSQLKNKERALKNLAEKLARIEDERVKAENAEERKRQRENSNKASPVRTYDYTANGAYARGGLKAELASVLAGGIKPFVDAALLNQIDKN
ncbi:MAG: PCRF domain-containing protein [Clostridiaceae bacterium]|jgi:peptide chain release factor 1|nr:PCRF domain-containing protein [Clostridiaceae bacterium]